jgi:hypothetical protein
MKTGDFLFLFILWLAFQFTPHREKATLLLFGVMVLNMVSVAHMYIPRQLENYTEGDIQPGDVVSTFQYMVSEPFYIMHRQATALANGYSYFHTTLAVEYRGKTYILNSSPFFHFDRGHSPYLDQIEIVMKDGTWTMYLEPLESFLREERLVESYIRILDTGRKITYERAPSISSKGFVHCCYFLAKYMEGFGMCENKSSLHDALYYTPQYFGKRFKHKKDIKLNK